MPETKYNKNQNTNPYYNRLIHHLDDTNKIKSKYDKKKSLHFLLEDVDRKYGNQYTNNSTIQDYWNNSYMPMKEMKIPPPKLKLKKHL